MVFNQASWANTVEIHYLKAQRFHIYTRVNINMSRQVIFTSLCEVHWFLKNRI